MQNIFLINSDDGLDITLPGPSGINQQVPALLGSHQQGEGSSGTTRQVRSQFKSNPTPRQISTSSRIKQNVTKRQERELGFPEAEYQRRAKVK